MNKPKFGIGQEVFYIEQDWQKNSEDIFIQKACNISMRKILSVDLEWHPKEPETIEIEYFTCSTLDVEDTDGVYEEWLRATYEEACQMAIDYFNAKEDEND